MRRRLLWLIALAGLSWLWLRRRARRPQPVVDIPPARDPAEELRRKLDETKEQVETAGPSAATDDPAASVASSSSDPAAAAPAGTEDLDAKRREVHDQARSAADEMRHTSSD
jgi:hypothetical protein